MNAYFIYVIIRVQIWFMYAQLLDDQTQKDVWVFHVFLEVIFVTLVLKSFFSKCQFFSVEKLCFWHFREWPPVGKFLRNFNFLKISGKEFREYFATQTWLTKIYLVHLHISRVGSQVTNSWNAEKDSFKGLKMPVFKIFIFFHSALPHTTTHTFLQNSTKLHWILSLRLH